MRLLRNDYSVFGQILNQWLPFGKNYQNQSNHHQTVCCYKGCSEGSVLTSKTAFFCYIAGIVELFLKEYQTDIPNILFLYFDLKAVIRNLVIVMVPAVIEACCSGKQFTETDLSKRGNLLPLSKISLGFPVEKEINTLTKSGVVTIQQINKLKRKCKRFCCWNVVQVVRFNFAQMC